MSDTMVPYLVTATDARGVRDTFARDADSLESLRAALESDGYADIEFIDDEISARLRQRRPAHLRPTTADDYRREARSRAPGGTGPSWWTAIRNNLTLLVPLLALGIYGAVRQSIILCAIPAGLIAAWVVYVWRARGRADDYSELVRAGARGDREVEAALIERLLSQSALTDNARKDVRFRRMRLRARDGDLDGALAELAADREAQSLVPGLYETRVGSLYYAVGDMTNFLAAAERGYVASGETATNRLDLAFSHARVGDPRRARTLLESVDRRNISPLHQPIAMAIDGLVARSEGDETTAARMLGEAVEAFSAFQDKAAVWPIMGILRGHHALSLARIGRSDEARATLRDWHDVARASLDPQTCEALDAALASGA